MRSLLLLLFFQFSVLFSQENIRIETELSSKEQSVTLKKIDVNVEIVSDIAITTFDLQFYNPNDRVLEGEFFFPLGQGQSVTRFALEIDKKLRDAVVVEKEKARVAFESTVKKQIDPALLEVTKGNNYKARIYPIPAKGYKRLVITTKQKLAEIQNSYFYKLPILTDEPLEGFKFNAGVLKLGGRKPTFKSEKLSDFSFNNIKNQYTTSYKSTRFKNNDILIKIPMKGEQQLLTYNDFFYLKTDLNLPKEKTEELKKVTIFWDNSFSQKLKNKDRELTLLKTFFKKNKNLKVNFVAFNASFDFKKSFNILDGDWSGLKKEINEIIYDGGTSFEALKTYEDDAEQYLLFTDGMNTLSHQIKDVSKRIYVINSAFVSNHAYLTQLTEENKGKYINLLNTSTKEAIKQLNTKPLLFLGTNLSSEVFPKEGSVVSSNFSLSGYGLLKQEKIKLYFGYDNKIEKTITINAKNISVKNNCIEKNWVADKIEFLSRKLEENKSEIIKISKKHQIISAFTSLLILDRVEDYVTHEIEPPKELLKVYKKLLSNKQENKKERFKNYKSGLNTWYKKLFEWHKTDFKPTALNQSNSKKSIENTFSKWLVYNSLEKTIRGTVSDELGGLPSVNIIIEGTSKGTESDFDGKYSIKANVGDVLVYSFIGMETVKKTVGAANKIDVVLKESEDNVLQEVVILGYATVKKESVAGYSVTVVSSESIESSVNSGSQQGLRGREDGKVSGVTLLYVVDGKETHEQPSLKPEDIRGVYELTPKQGIQLKGEKGKNGILVYTTNKGYEKNSKAIEEFEKLVADKLEFKGWNPDMPYLKELEKVSDKKLYAKYLEIRSANQNSPSFFIDVADVFQKRKMPKLALKILSNVVEIEIDNYELLRALAYKYEEYKQWDKAVFIYEEVVKLRPENIQSYRDLALALEENGEYQRSLDLFYKIVSGGFSEKVLNDDFEGIEMMSLLEMNHLITRYKNKLQTAHIEKKYLKKMSMDVRVLIDWNHKDTDIDLWVTEPTNEKCYYKNNRTKIGGWMPVDMTEGFGPEQFVLKKAVKGSYTINVDYYGDSQQKISGPTFLKLTYFKNYGKPNEVKKIKLVRLEKEEVKELTIGAFIY